LVLAALALVVFGAYDSYPTVLRMTVFDSLDSKNSLIISKRGLQIVERG